MLSSPAASPTAHPATGTADTAVLDAIREAVAYIEFTPRGQLLATNKLFLKTVGHSREEVIGQHHRMFCSGANFVVESISSIPRDDQ